MQSMQSDWAVPVGQWRNGMWSLWFHDGDAVPNNMTNVSKYIQIGEPQIEFRGAPTFRFHFNGHLHSVGRSLQWHFLRSPGRHLGNFQEEPEEGLLHKTVPRS